MIYSPHFVCCTFRKDPRSGYYAMNKTNDNYELYSNAFSDKFCYICRGEVVCAQHAYTGAPFRIYVMHRIDTNRVLRRPSHTAQRHLTPSRAYDYSGDCCGIGSSSWGAHEASWVPTFSFSS